MWNSYYYVFKIFLFVVKYMQNDIKDKYLVLLHNKNFGDSSQHFMTFLFYFRGYPGIPWEIPVTINIY